MPTIRIEHLDEDQVLAFLLADNKLAANADWSRELLAVAFQRLIKVDLQLLDLTGFETPEIDLTIQIAELAEEQDDDVLPLPSGPTVTQPGDRWCIGGLHYLVCGDATDAAAYARLLDGERAQIVFTDAPYNVPIDGHVGGLGSIKHREFPMATGEMSRPAFTGFLSSAFANLASHSLDGAIHYICMDWRHMGEVLAAGETAYSALLNLCVWTKTNGGMGSFYRSQHELVFVFKAGTGRHINNVELGRHGRYRTNVWSYPGINSFGRNRDEELAMHPTVKPLALVSDAILDSSRRNGIVLDAFAGSGTTLLAAHRTGRRGYGIEIDPAYCDVIIRRLMKSAGLEAVHTSSGRTFAEIAVEKVNP